MSNGFSIDVSDLRRLTTELGAVADDAHRNVRKAVEHSADAIKKGWNGKLYSDGHAKYTGRAIDFDVTEGVLGVGADIGARRGSGKQAGVVLLLEYGSVNNAPHGAGSGSLDENLPDFEDRLGLALWDGMRDHGFS